MRHFLALTLSAVLVLALGCSSKSAKEEVVDLDKVLAIFDEVANESRDGEANAEAESATDPVESETVTEEEPELAEDDPAAVTEFLVAFQEKLNAANLIESTITVTISDEGKIIGFKDVNADHNFSTAETQYFTIEIDQESERMIATQTINDGTTYHRDHRYSGRSHFGGGGFFWGYMIGSMGRRQNHYYGSGMGTRPNYSSMNMSQRGYHSSAVSRSRSHTSRTRSSSRGRGGSGGFRGGK